MALFRRNTSVPDHVRVDADVVPIRWVRHRRARHYILRLTADGALRVTIPPFGSRKEGYEFVRGHREWIRARVQEERRREPANAWGDGTEVLFRGESVPLTVDADLFAKTVRFANQTFVMPPGDGDLRGAVRGHLRALAVRELVPRTREEASRRGLRVNRVAVRDQRTLWGSCSRHGNISLNWRLVQAPVAVRDYVILHELMHLAELNHSSRFWTLVEQACPCYKEAEQWLKAHDMLLRA